MSRDYVAAAKHYLPPGKALPRRVAGWLHKLVSGFVPQFERVDALAADLLDEYFPPTANLLLDDWERVFGLPGDCGTPPTDLAERQAAVEARLAAHGDAIGGTGVAYLTALAAKLGYAITVRKHYRQPRTCVSTCITPMQTRQWLWVWEVIANHKSDDQDARMQCELERVAINTLTFSFPLFQLSELTYTRAAGATFTDPVTGYTKTLAADEPGIAYLGI